MVCRMLRRNTLLQRNSCAPSSHTFVIKVDLNHLFLNQSGVT